MLEETEGGNQG